MAMTPFALALLGAESINRRAQDDQSEPSPAQHRPTNTMRRTTSYHNQFQTACSSSSDDPPSYAVAVKRAPLPEDRLQCDVLPKYQCTVAAESRFLVNLESMNPLHAVSECEWREVYVVLRGTLLSFHRPKDNGPGRLLRNYTLQHAEIGLATDAEHTILVPQTRLANLIPSAARQRAWKRDPGLFRPVRQHILRLRAETDQFLLAAASEELIHSFIHSVSAAIDISHAIDERTAPRQCTVPRRRRRPQRAANSSDLSDPALLAEQERILRDVYPDFAAQVAQSQPEGEAQTPSTESEPAAEAPATPMREEDEPDLSLMREDTMNSAPSASTPSLPQQDDSAQPSTSSSDPSSEPTTSTSNITYSADMMYETSHTNFCPLTEKWQPPHHRTQQQIQRYVRRCMPILLSDATRASDVLIRNGRRVKINWRMELLEEWELKPPSYKSHGFESDTTAETAASISSSSVAGSAAQGIAPASTSVLVSESDDAITPIEEVSLATLSLELTKSVTADKTSAPSRVESSVAKTPSTGGADVHGMIFCF